MQARTDQPEPRAPQAGERSAPGTVIGGRYTLRTAIGHGGMGTVWRAADTLLRRDVAVKEVLLPPGVAENDKDQIYQRTLREARAAAALSHPSVVQVYDVVTEGGRPWIVMELLQSRSLAEMIIEDGPLAGRAVAKIGVALLGALEVAHAAGVLHRDVKPANVLICSDGRCVLTDFGVARMPADAQLTTPGMVLGSPHFISPERAIGAKFGPPSDLFSLGVTLYTAVEGRPPFDKRDPFETMRAIVEEPPTTPLRAGPLAGVLFGLLEKDPARRWDVPATRKVLRELLAGALASNAAVHVTDPYAVVRPAPLSTPAAAPIAAGQIGGRAMLAPGESISSAIRRRDAEENGLAPAQRSGSAPGATDLPDTGAYTPPQLSNAAPTQRVPSPGAPGGHRAAHQSSPPQSSPPQSSRAGMYGQPVHQGSVYGAQPGAYGPGQNGFFIPEDQRTTVRVGSPRERVISRITSAPRWALAAAGGTLALVLLVSGLAMAGVFSDDTPQRVGTTPVPTATSASPLIPAQQYRDDRGFTVNVPSGWTKNAIKNRYVDFVDPADSRRRLRINVEEASGTAQTFLEAAEKNLKKANSGCPAYARVQLTSTVTLDTQPASELEYTCGSGPEMRHGTWRAVVEAGYAYHFFVSVQEERFTESGPIYQEMVRSFHFTGQASGTPTT